MLRIVLILLLLPLSSYSLPKCEGEDYKKWDRCDGTLTLANGSRYVGEWKDGLPNGKVTEILANGDKYVGEYKDGKRHGEGTYTFANGHKYVGEFKDDFPNGKVTETLPNGDKYVGEYKDGKRHGEGTYTLSNGYKYVGEYKDGKRHGKGTETFPNGDKYVSEWKDGEIIESRKLSNFLSEERVDTDSSSSFSTGNSFVDLITWIVFIILIAAPFWIVFKIYKYIKLKRSKKTEQPKTSQPEITNTIDETNNESSKTVLNEEEEDDEEIKEIKEEDFENLVSKFNFGEKFTLMVGLIGLYGDGELSEREIGIFQNVTDTLNFNTDGLIHKDPSDLELCKIEKSAFFINMIRDDFSKSNFTDEDIKKLFRAFSISIGKDIGDDKQKQDNLVLIKDNFKEIAKADGKMSKKELELINIFIDNSGFSLVNKGKAKLTIEM